MGFWDVVKAFDPTAYGARALGVDDKYSFTGAHQAAAEEAFGEAGGDPFGTEQAMEQQRETYREGLGAIEDLIGKGTGAYRAAQMQGREDLMGGYGAGRDVLGGYYGAARADLGTGYDAAQAGLAGTRAGMADIYGRGYGALGMGAAGAMGAIGAGMAGARAPLQQQMAMDAATRQAYGDMLAGTLSGVDPISQAQREAGMASVRGEMAKYGGLGSTAQMGALMSNEARIRSQAQDRFFGRAQALMDPTAARMASQQAMQAGLAGADIYGRTGAQMAGLYGQEAQGYAGLGMTGAEMAARRGETMAGMGMATGRDIAGMYTGEGQSLAGLGMDAARGRAGLYGQGMGSIGGMYGALGSTYRSWLESPEAQAVATVGGYALPRLGG